MRLFIIFFILFIISAPSSLIGQNQVDTALVSNLIIEGDRFLAKRQFGEAIEKYTELGNIAIENKLWDKYYFSECGIIECLWKQYKVEDAVQKVDLALSTVSSKLGNDSKEEALLNFNYGTIHIINGKYDSAISRYDQAVYMFLKDSSKTSLGTAASCYTNTGYLYEILGNMNTALGSYLKADTLQRQLFGNENIKIVNNINNIAGNYARRRIWDKAISYYESAIDILDKNNDNKSLLYNVIIKNLASCYEGVGKTEKATDYKFLALNNMIQLTGEHDVEIATFYAAFARSLTEQGLYDSSKYYLRRPLKVIKELEVAKVPDAKNVYGELAKIELKLKNFEEAENYALKNIAIDIRIGGEKNYSLINSYSELAKILIEKGDLERGKNYLNEALAISYSNIDISTDFSNIVYDLFAEIYIKQGDYDSAFLMTNKGLFFKGNFWEQDVLEDFTSGALVQLFNTLLIRLEVLESQYVKSKDKIDFEKLLMYFERVDLVINHLRHSYNSLQDKRDIVNKSIDVYSSAVKYNLEAFSITNAQKYLNASFYYSEKSKASVLNDVLTYQKAKDWSGIQYELIDIEQDARADLNYYKTSLQQEKNKKEKADTLKLTFFHTKILNLNKSLDSLLNIFEENYPEYYALKYRDKTPSVKDVQSKLSEGEAVIEYLSNDSTVYVFYISKNGFRIEEMEIQSSIDSLSFEFRNKMVDHQQNKRENKLNEISHQLYKYLLHPIEEFIDSDGINKLTIVPDGSLGYIPFELLLKQPVNPDTSYDRYPYLIKDYEISYAYSAALLFNENQGNSNDGELISFAPSYQFENKELTATRSAELGRFRNAFVELNFNQEEASAITEFSDNGVVKLANQATERTFKENAGDAKVLHLAMHAFIDDEDPMNSKLVFYQDNDSIEDGYLHTFELFNIDLNADMAVLSACETGYGKLVKGEGIMSLARGFSYAGVPSVVMSHWKVDDRSTSQLMKYFYKNLADGKTKSQALREAKLTYLNEASPNKMHPFYWGAFVVVGDDSPLENKNNNWIYYLIVVIVILITGYLIQTKKKKQFKPY